MEKNIGIKKHAGKVRKLIISPRNNQIVSDTDYLFWLQLEQESHICVGYFIAFFDYYVFFFDRK